MKTACFILNLSGFMSESFTLKMDITMINFRCWKEKTFTFPAQGITLLKGYSGTGKSTILQALYWCLYGKLNNISPKGNEGVTTSVMLSLPYITIFRQRNPTDFYVETIKKGKKKVMNLEQAQDEIKRVFGCKNIWLSCSYIEQETRNIILTGTNKDKEDLLLRLSEDLTSARLIEITKDEIKDLRKSLSKKEITLDIHKDKYKNYKTKISKVEEYLSKHDKKTLRKDLVSKKAKLEEELIKREKHKSLVSTQAAIQDEIESLGISLGKLKLEPIDVSDLNLYQERDNILSKIKDYMFPENVDPERVSLNISEYKAYRNSLTKLEIKNFEDIAKEIDTLQELLDIYDVYQSYKALVKVDLPKSPKLLPIMSGIEKPVFNIDINVDDISQELDDISQELTTVTNDISRLNKDKKRICTGNMKCPSCGAFVQYHEGHLTLNDINVLVQIKNDINNLEERKTELSDKKKELLSSKSLYEKQVKIFAEKERKYLDDQAKADNEEINSLLMSEYNDKKSKYDEYNKKQKEYTDILGNKVNKLSKLSKKEIEERINQLTNVKRVSRPLMNYEELQEYIKMNNLRMELDKLPETDSKITYLMLKTKHEEYIKNYNLKVRYTSRLDELISQVVDIPPYIDGVKDIRNNIKDIESKMETLREYTEQKELYTLIKTLKDTITKLEKEVIYLVKYKDICLRAINIKLDDIVCDINSYLSSICSSLFQESVNVVLNLVKETKKGLSKNTINISVYLNGIEFGFREISSGQRDRINIALTTCLNIISNSPIIIFDESMSYLDNMVRELSIKCLKSYCEDKTCICVNQMGVEGEYDTKINLNHENIKRKKRETLNESPVKRKKSPELKVKIRSK